jgi:hypothetical protein
MYLVNWVKIRIDSLWSCNFFIKTREEGRSFVDFPFEIK